MMPTGRETDCEVSQGRALCDVPLRWEIGAARDGGREQGTNLPFSTMPPSARFLVVRNGEEAPS